MDSLAAGLAVMPGGNPPPEDRQPRGFLAGLPLVDLFQVDLFQVDDRVKVLASDRRTGAAVGVQAEG